MLDTVLSSVGNLFLFPEILLCFSENSPVSVSSEMVLRYLLLSSFSACLPACGLSVPSGPSLILADLRSVHDGLILSVCPYSRTGQLIVWMTLQWFRCWPLGRHWGPVSPELNASLSIICPSANGRPWHSQSQTMDPCSGWGPTRPLKDLSASIIFWNNEPNPIFWPSPHIWWNLWLLPDYLRETLVSDII